MKIVLVPPPPEGYRLEVRQRQYEGSSRSLHMVLSSNYIEAKWMIYVTWEKPEPCGTRLEIKLHRPWIVETLRQELDHLHRYWSQVNPQLEKEMGVWTPQFRRLNNVLTAAKNEVNPQVEAWTDKVLEHYSDVKIWRTAIMHAVRQYLIFDLPASIDGRTRRALKRRGLLDSANALHPSVKALLPDSHKINAIEQKIEAMAEQFIVQIEGDAIDGKKNDAHKIA